jgi:hypothetical protein
MPTLDLVHTLLYLTQSHRASYCLLVQEDEEQSKEWNNFHIYLYVICVSQLCILLYNKSRSYYCHAWLRGILFKGLYESNFSF